MRDDGKCPECGKGIGHFMTCSQHPDHAQFDQMAEIRLEMTCGACPEQYDAYVDDELVGYLRLRHGYFRVDFPDTGGETIYEANTIGDGIFDESERDHHLQQAKYAIAAKLAVSGSGGRLNP